MKRITVPPVLRPAWRLALVAVAAAAAFMVVAGQALAQDLDRKSVV